MHEYFDRKSSEWNIIGFLDECDDTQSFPDKIGYYLTSLQVIIKNESGKRHEKALQLFEKYKQASSRMLLAKNIDKEWWRGRDLQDLCHSSL